MRRALCSLLLFAVVAQGDEVDYSALRAELVAEVEYYAKLAWDSDEATLSADVIRSLSTVERHKFVPRARGAMRTRIVPSRLATGRRFRNRTSSR